MDPTDIGMFRLVEQRLAWVDRRQQLLAQNVANANTPGYSAHDMAPFAMMLASPGMAMTSPLHIAAGGQSSGQVTPKWAERAPGGNTISIEDQLGKIADTAGMQGLMLNLHRSYQGMIRTALGRAG